MLNMKTASTIVLLADQLQRSLGLLHTSLLLVLSPQKSLTRLLTLVAVALVQHKSFPTERKSNQLKRQCICWLCLDFWSGYNLQLM